VKKILIAAIALTVAPAVTPVMAAAAPSLDLPWSSDDRVCVNIKSTTTDSTPITAWIDDWLSGQESPVQIKKGYCSNYYRRGQITHFLIHNRNVCTSQWGGVYRWDYKGSGVPGWYRWTELMNGPLDLTCKKLATL
jgi:hypothetical protein